MRIFSSKKNIYGRTLPMHPFDETPGTGVSRARVSILAAPLLFPVAS